MNELQLGDFVTRVNAKGTRITRRVLDMQEGTNDCLVTLSKNVEKNPEYADIQYERFDFTTKRLIADGFEKLEPVVEECATTSCGNDSDVKLAAIDAVNRANELLTALLIK